MADTRILTCIVCPRGCELSVSLADNGEALEVSGHSCPRGKDYAIAECTSPVRTVTSTALREDNTVVSVKTAAPIPKSMIFDVMKEINATVVPNDAKIGDVAIRDVSGTGVDVVITSNR